MPTYPATNTTDDARRGQYHVWRGFVDGTQPAPRPRPGETNSVYNYARLLIRKAASYVFPDPVAFQVIDDNGKPAEGNKTEAHIAALYAGLDLHEFDLNQEIERSTIGDCCEKITWDAKTGMPRIVSVDPATITARWSPDNPTTAIEIQQEYTAPAWAMKPYGLNATNPAQEVRVLETWTDEFWTLEIPSHQFSKIEPNPYGWIPYLVLPNAPEARSFWGKSDLVDMRQAQLDLNRELTTMGRIMDLSGMPIAVLENVDSSEALQVRPGAKWELPEGSKAYLLDLLSSGGVRLHLDYIEQLRQVINDLTETPKTAFGDTGTQLSGAAMEIEIQPMVQKVKRKRAGWTRHYSERNRRLLDLVTRYGNAELDSQRNTAPIWPPILPSDMGDMVLQQTQLVGAGVRSIVSANRALGMPDPERELELIRAEQASDPESEATNATRNTDTEESRTRQEV